MDSASVHVSQPSSDEPNYALLEVQGNVGARNSKTKALASSVQPAQT